METIYEEAGESLQRRFQSARTALKQMFAQPTEVTIDDKRITNGDVFDAFFYGQYAHSTKRAMLDEWAQTPFVYALLENQFFVVVAHLAGVIRYVSLLNEELLDDLGAN